MRGCEVCSMQGVMQFKGEDEDLVAFYEQTRQELLDYLENDGPPPEGFYDFQT
jgi:hypothetical protein